jgi:hypothetical protein
LWWPFDSTSVEGIMKAAEQHRNGGTVCWWVSSMPGSRKITATFAGENPEGSMVKGCPHRAFYCLCCKDWLWTNSYEDSMKMAVIHWGMQMILLSQ